MNAGARAIFVVPLGLGLSREQRALHGEKLLVVKYKFGNIQVYHSSIYGRASDATWYLGWFVAKMFNLSSQEPRLEGK